MRPSYHYLLLTLWACHPRPTPDTDRLDVVMGECGAPIIYDHLIAPPLGYVEGVTPVLPDSYHDADKRFAVAATKFADRRFIDAARDFLVVARRLDDAAKDFLIETQRLGLNSQAEVFRRDRIIAYENAAMAYEEAHALDEGRRELTQRADQDSSCAGELERIVRNMRSYNCEHTAK